MPIEGYKSLCERNALVITSKDDRNPQKHIGHNKKTSFVTHYRIDGVIIEDGQKCDFLLINEEDAVAYLIELKGSDLTKAAEQLEETEKKLSKILAKYDIKYRIVAKKCRTQEIESSKFRKYRARWKGKLLYKSMVIEENI